MAAQSQDVLRVLALVPTSPYAVCLDLLQRGLALAIPRVQKEQLGPQFPRDPQDPLPDNNPGKMMDRV